MLLGHEVISSPEQFIDWTKACITSPPFSVVINCSLEDYFHGGKGLRQGGDPVSPYIFVVVFEVLPRMINKAAEQGKFPFHTICSKNQVINFVFC